MPQSASLWHRLRPRWPLALLLASIGVTAVAGLDALRVARSNHARRCLETRIGKC